jgi:hypothetical protein
MGSNPILAAAVAGGCGGWLDCAAEAWPSGRRHTPGKRVGGQLPRGFEPLSLRHRIRSSTCGFAQAVVGWSVLGPSQPGQQRAWTAEDGSARSAVEVVADELGPSLRWATATTTRTTRSQDR